jgi:hypothetical protein
MCLADQFFIQISFDEMIFCSQWVEGDHAFPHKSVKKKPFYSDLSGPHKELKGKTISFRWNLDWKIVPNITRVWLLHAFLFRTKLVQTFLRKEKCPNLKCKCNLYASRSSPIESQFLCIKVRIIISHQLLSIWKQLERILVQFVWSMCILASCYSIIKHFFLLNIKGQD